VGTHVVTVTESGAATGSATITVTVTAAYPAALPGGPPPGFEFPIFGASARPRRMPANRAAIVASCMFATGGCHGTIVLRSARQVRDRPGHKPRVVALGRKDFTLAPSTRATIAVTVPRKMRTLVSKLRRLGAIAVVTVHDDAGHTATDSVALTLTAAR
jgi:hypothetical protein